MLLVGTPAVVVLTGVEPSGAGPGGPHLHHGLTRRAPVLDGDLGDLPEDARETILVGLLLDSRPGDALGAAARIRDDRLASGFGRCVRRSVGCPHDQILPVIRARMRRAAMVAT